MEKKKSRKHKKREALTESRRLKGVEAFNLFNHETPEEYAERVFQKSVEKNTRLNQRTKVQYTEKVTKLYKRASETVDSTKTAITNHKVRILELERELQKATHNFKKYQAIYKDYKDCNIMWGHSGEKLVRGDQVHLVEGNFFKITEEKRLQGFVPIGVILEDVEKYLDAKVALDVEDINEEIREVVENERAEEEAEETEEAEEAEEAKEAEVPEEEAETEEILQDVAFSEDERTDTKPTQEEEQEPSEEEITEQEEEEDNDQVNKTV